MEQIELALAPDERKMTSVFLGLDRHRRVAGNSNSLGHYTAMADCLNMTSEEYPCAMVRARRIRSYCQYRNKTDPDCAANGADIRYAPANILDAVMIGEELAYLCADGTVMCGEKHWKNAKQIGEGRIYPFGHGLFSPANNMWIRDVTDGEKFVLPDSEVTAHYSIRPTDETGADFYSSAEAPAAPKDGEYWYCTGAENEGLYRYDAEKEDWTAWPLYYVKVSPRNAESGDRTADMTEFLNACLYLLTVKPGDAVNITEHVADPQETETEPDDIGFITVENVLVGEDVIHPGLILKTQHAPVDRIWLTICRKAPVFDHAVVHNNRIWACRFGQNAYGQFVNEIYACRLGDPTNWFSYQGTDDDSFSVTVGEEGEWTGAAVVGDHVVFFKENVLYTVYGDTPGDYRVQATYCSGIARGSEKSAVTINGALYYLSPHGIMRLYSGTMPQPISDDLLYKNVLRAGIAGTDGRKYYLQARSTAAGNKRSWLYVYDTALDEWHIEDAVHNAVAFVPFENELLAVSSASFKTDEQQYEYYQADHVFISPPGSAEMAAKMIPLCFIAPDTEALIYPDDDEYYPNGFSRNVDALMEKEQEIRWSFETGDFGHETSEYKRLKSIALRAWMEKGAAMTIEIQYDEDGNWVVLADRSESIPEGATGTTRVEYRLRRCDLYRLRISGTGRVCVYSITHTYEGEGDRSYGNAV